jgi:hypothetical protein
VHHKTSNINGLEKSKKLILFFYTVFYTV